jgi:phosphoglycolate phosphatase
MVMIGDTLHDFDTAQAMGTDCILAAIGHQSEADLKKAGVPVVTAFSQLRGLLLPEKVLIAK